MINKQPTISIEELQDSRLTEIRSSLPEIKEIAGLKILVEPNVYNLGTDSYLCARTISIPKQARALDIGTGTGVLALKLASLGASEVIGVDINPYAIKNANKNKQLNDSKNVSFVVGNLFEHVMGKFDVIVYNPPYRNAEPIDEVSMCFYDSGHQSVKQFFEGLRTFLNPSGVAYLAWSNIGPLDLLPQLAAQHNLSIELLGTDFGRHGYEFYVYSLRF